MSEILDQDRITGPSQVSMMPTALRYGGIAALIAIAVGLIFNLTGFSNPADPQAGGNLFQSIIGYTISFLAPIFAIKHHRDEELGGYLSFGRGLGMGTLTGVFLGLFTAIWILVFFYLISPDLVEAIRKMAYQRALDQGATEETMEAAKGMMGFFTSPPFFAIAGFFVTLLFSFLGSLLGGLMFRREVPAQV